MNELVFAEKSALGISKFWVKFNGIVIGCWYVYPKRRCSINL